MKKSISMLCVMALCILGVQAQSGNPQLQKIFRMLTAQPRTAGVHVQKSAEDSLLTSFTIYDVNADSDCFTQSLYERQDENQYEHTQTDYQFLVEGRVMESGSLDARGDTLQKTVYVYDTTSTQLEIYSYEEQDPMLVEKAIYYGMNNLATGTDVNLENNLMNFGNLFFCDSMLVEIYDESDTSMIKGVYTYDSLGYPKVLTINAYMYKMNFVILIDFCFTDSLITSFKASMLMEGLSIPMDILSCLFSYNEKGQLIEREMIADPSAEALLGYGRSKSVYAYDNDLIYSVSEYNCDLSDTAAGPQYELSTRDYYTYKQGNALDTVYSYTFGVTGEDGVATVSGLNVRISPNPVKDMLQLSGLESETEVGVYTADGKKALSARVQAGESSLSMRSLPNGVYFIRLQSKDGIAVKQIVKQ